MRRRKSRAGAARATRDEHHEHDARRAQAAEAGEIVLTVGIDDGCDVRESARRPGDGRSTTTSAPSGRGSRQRLDAGRAAVDGDDEPGAPFTSVSMASRFGP